MFKDLALTSRSSGRFLGAGSPDAPRVRQTRPMVVLTLASLLGTGASAATLATATQDSLRLTLPPALYAVPGVPMSVYHDNMVLTETPEAYRFEVACDIGKSEAGRWTVTPSGKDAGDHPMDVTVEDALGRELARAKTVLRVVRRDAGNGRGLRLLIIGDSLTAATTYPNEIARLLSEPGNPKWTMLGTHRPPSARAGVAHEGYGGWTWASFLSRYDPKHGHALDEAGKRHSSPFVYPVADGQPVLDIARYIRENCEDQSPDVVTILLGINDCFSVNPDDAKAIDARIDKVMGDAERFLKAFRAASSRAVFAIGLTTPPNSRESGFEANYKGKYHRWGWKRIQHRIVMRMLEQFAGRESDGIQIVPTELNLDPTDGYPDNNGVHPNATGYRQIGASFYCWIKWWLQTTQP
ncbi:MAG TPA: GDSL-type esterase/lipase family protein [Verrucomicrobiae bacterium]|nr:GDSL-type esterase/lipase family protein [Verrucomicrobiae bacterium]